MRDKLSQVSVGKQIMYDKKNQSPFEVGEQVSVPERLVSKWTKDGNKNVNATIVKVNKKTLIVRSMEYRQEDDYKINKTDVVARDLFKIGGNPFKEKFENVRIVAFQLSSIIHSMDLTNDRREEPIKMSGVEIKELNWNPFVTINGTKQYYQRGLCWSLKDKQLLIESIYNGIDCGKILIRMHSWAKLERLAKNGETELGFKDIVDGKQRMDAIRGFINNEYYDLHGNLYGDLSNYSQYKFTDHQLFGYAEMPENTTDEEVIYQFLKMNFTGVPQSQEHLDFVKEISKTFNK